jgi:hypothetical protein
MDKSGFASENLFGGLSYGGFRCGGFVSEGRLPNNSLSFSGAEGFVSTMRYRVANEGSLHSY